MNVCTGMGIAAGDGPTTVYAFMQAMGLINDHVEGCVIRAEAHSAHQAFARPGYLPRSAAGRLRH
ncbi:DNA-3-methyladenine glycosylase I [Nonomuraea sp. NPDC048882]|uniref:DNA-3-methyladenine glycosylase I n=1 Tax=Nonomuraea sp. NPDC048882 TaxID=3154347 RepID=UPI0033FAEF9D